MTDKNTVVLQSCTVALRAEHGLCSETSVQSSDDSNEVIAIKIVGEVVRIKEEDEPIAISFSTIKDEPEVSPQTFHQYLVLPSVIMPFCPSAFPHKSAPYGKWNWSVCMFRVCKI
jgi:hypothetical protein